MRGWFLGAAMGACACVVSTGFASETTTYTYDELGRLVSSLNSGGPRNGKAALTSFDPAGNRVSHAVGLPSPAPSNAAVFSVSPPPSGGDEGTSAVFTISKTGPASSNLSVNYATVNGSAVAPGDFVAASGTLTFRSWETARTVSIPLLVDTNAEPAESFSVQLSAPSSGATIGVASANATINANSAPNQPPDAATDGASVGVCDVVLKNVVANDTDPEGNYPLSLVSITLLDTAKGSAFISGTTNISFTAYGSTGSARIDYVVQDSLGATATGRLNITITSGSGCS